MTFDDSMRFIYLMHLQRDLKYVKYHGLKLKTYDALVQEVDEEVEKIIKESKNVL
jgi:hypothetical protein